MNTAKFLKAICLALLVLGALRGGAAGQSAAATNEPSRQPILRIETGMHTATINRIGVDAAGRYLVTGSDDKTVDYQAEDRARFFDCGEAIKRKAITKAVSAS